ncbi:TRAP transporter small permease subunit [Pseudomonas sp. NW5]|uniref:TRAP transporter small permease subunit n=1 Tax=Pseudomonas sp. NW5 TaxID=2934934 RepID=UPI0020222E46|nr:TRAP transporter small permease subunit [Pseudomonas sp. NW5]MCL7463006.1 TRAP transporter small permease subunit [Pseudomonas sp. NW5]
MSSTSPPLLALARALQAVNDRLGRACAWLTLFLVLGTTVVVVLRYGFGIGAIALQEAVIYAHALVFMGAAAWTLQRGGHVRVDIFYQKRSPRAQALTDLLGHLFLLLPVCLFLAWNSWGYVSASWSTLEGSSDAGGLPYVYLQKSIILVLLVSLILQALADVIVFAYRLSGRLPFPEVQHG